MKTNSKAKKRILNLIVKYLSSLPPQELDHLWQRIIYVIRTQKRAELHYSWQRDRAEVKWRRK